MRSTLTRIIVIGACSFAAACHRDQPPCPVSAPQQAATQRADEPTSHQAPRNPYLGVPASIRAMYHPKRFPDVYLLRRPGYLIAKLKHVRRIRSGEDPRVVGHHGTPWGYDSDVPIVFYGQGVKAGVVGAEAHLTDIAPTLAYLAGVGRPSAASGRVLQEIIEPRVATWSLEERPRALVLVSLDQGRPDYLGTYGDALSFLRERIVARGATFARGRIQYARTVTTVSHATVGTGALPALHSILDNELLRDDGTFGRAVDDGSKEPTLGHGDMSAAHLQAPTLADELDLRFDNRAVVVGGSSRARAAVALLGHGAALPSPAPKHPASDHDIVFSCNTRSGVPYTNEAFYRLPEYFDVRKNPQVALKAWLATHYGVELDTGKWTEATRYHDRGPFSASKMPFGPAGARFPWGQGFSFSHRLINTGAPEPEPLQRFSGYRPGKTRLSDRYERLLHTPLVDLWCADLSLLAMQREGFGQDAIPDIALFHAKSLDLIGHRYGVRSGELYAYLFSADYLLRKVVTWLDQKVGRDRYVLAVFADHGATNVHAGAQWIAIEEVAQAIEAQFGKGIVRKLIDDQLWLQHDELRAHGVTVQAVARWMQRQFPWLLRAYSRDEVASSR